MHAIVHPQNYRAVGVDARATEIFRQSLNEIHKRTDHLIAYLMFFQWVAGIAAAKWISPNTWIGASSKTHIHMWAAVFLGGAITSLPIILAWKRPGTILSRHIIAVGQTLTSALLIHLTGGRIETHFHVFGSLAILAFYRDGRVLLTATFIVAADHFARGLFWPQSVFGTLSASSWRWLEHAGWVLFEVTFLMISIRQSKGDMWEVALRRANLENTNSEIERLVEERTAELKSAHQQLVQNSRHAGMAEVATNVLHNVGNVLNSVNVSAEAVAEKVRNFRIENLRNVANMIKEHSDDLPAFLTHDPRGQKLPSYLVKLSESLAQPQQGILTEVNSLRGNIEHIKEVVKMQQSYARRAGVMEMLSPTDLVEDAIRINSAALERHSVSLVRKYEEVPELLTDRHQVMQILVNLLSNAKYALDDGNVERVIIVRVRNSDGGGVTIDVSDTGVGISQENLTRIFEHGFTTKKDGHGFGLHSGALAANELGGKLTAYSDGPGKGATFSLNLPASNTH